MPIGTPLLYYVDTFIYLHRLTNVKPSSIGRTNYMSARAFANTNIVIHVELRSGKVANRKRDSGKQPLISSQVATEAITAKSNDGFGALDCPEHAGLFQAGTNDRFAAGFSAPRAHK
jgi:hypothetical protein